VSLTVSKRVWERSKQRGSGLVLMLALADYANRQSVAWPKTKALAEQSRLGVRQVQVLLGELEEAGEIRIRRNTSGGREANLYLVTAGDETVSWPKTVSRERVNHSSQRVHCDSQRVHSDSQTGESGFAGRVHSDSQRVHSDSQTGESQFAPYKEIEPSIEPSDSLVNALVPEPLKNFHSELSGLPGYRPTKSFFDQVLKKYMGLDLVEEAIGMADWLDTPNRKSGGRTPRDDGKQANTSFVLRWLRKALDQQEARAKEDNRDDHGQAVGRAGGSEGGRAPEARPDGPRLRERRDVDE
jgi:hypothetical protein